MAETLKTIKPAPFEVQIAEDKLNAEKLFMHPAVRYDNVSNKTEFKIGLSNKREVLTIKVKGGVDYLLSEDGQKRLLEAAKSAEKKQRGISAEGAYYAMMYSLYSGAGGQVVYGSGLEVSIPRPNAIAEKKIYERLKSPNREERVAAAKALIRHETMQKIIADPDFKKLKKEFVFKYFKELDTAIDDYIALNISDKDKDRYWDLLVENPDNLRSAIAHLVFINVKYIYPEIYGIYS
ncbi:MAG: hypothetical protein QXU54_03150 [Candidatus Micrarchaeia archaeon]